LYYIRLEETIANLFKRKAGELEFETEFVDGLQYIKKQPLLKNFRRGHWFCWCGWQELNLQVVKR